MFSLFRRSPKLKKVSYSLLRNRANGVMPIVYEGNPYLVWGGRYIAKPEGVAGVKMAAEIAKPYEINVPTQDFCVPDVDKLKDGVCTALVYLEEGHQIYVGCMGGVGRTGLFLAALAKVCGVRSPIAYVRLHYMAHAVETQEQEAFIRAFGMNKAEFQNRMEAARFGYFGKYPKNIKWYIKSLARKILANW